MEKINKDVEDLKEKVKSGLKNYLEIKGIKFQKKNQFHCFNSNIHNHGDKDASASLKGNGFKCFGCGISGDIFTACNMIEGKPIEGKEFFNTLQHLCDTLTIPYSDEIFKLKPIKKQPPEKQMTAEYTYVDLSNKPQYRVRRFEWIDGEGEKKKDLIPSRLEDGKWINGYKDTNRILYRLPEVINAIKNGTTIFFVEGEKCVEIMRGLGFVATTISGGSNAWIKPHTLNYIPSLTGVNLVIMPDNDRAGKKFAELVAEDVSPIANSIKLIELSGLPPKGDIEQWIQLGGTEEKLKDLVLTTKEWSRSEKVIQQQKSIYIKNNCYFKRCKDYDKKISNFIIEPVECIEGDNIQEYKSVAKTDSGLKLEIMFDLDMFTNKGKFKSVFRHPALSYTGNEDDLQDIKVLFGSQPHDSKQGVTCIGFHKNNDVFITTTKAVDKSGQKVEDIIMLDRFKQLTSTILDEDLLTTEELKKVANSMFKYNDISRTALILGFCQGCFFKTKLKKIGHKFPHLFIFGGAGSGKSDTTENIISPIFGVTRQIQAKGLTKFTAMKNSTSSNTIPYIINEYKPWNLNKFELDEISNLLRNTYDGYGSDRGNQDQTVTSYTYQAPIIIVGEAGTDEGANVERDIEVIFSKEDIENNKEFEKNYMFLKNNQPLLKKLGRSMLQMSFDTSEEELKNSFKFYSEKLEATMPSYLKKAPFRIKQAINICFIGVVYYFKLCKKHGIELDYTLEDLKNVIFKTVFENNMGGEENSKSIVDKSLETMDIMAGHKIYSYQIDYIVIKDHTQLALDLKSMYDRYTKYVKDYNRKDEVLSYNQFTKQLRNAPYFAEKINPSEKGYRPVKFSGKLKQAFILDIENLRKHGSFNNFI